MLCYCPKTLNKEFPEQFSSKHSNVCQCLVHLPNLHIIIQTFFLSSSWVLIERFFFFLIHHLNHHTALLMPGDYLQHWIGSSGFLLCRCFPSCLKEMCSLSGAPRMRACGCELFQIVSGRLRTWKWADSCKDCNVLAGGCGLLSIVVTGRHCVCVTWPGFYKYTQA